MLKACPSEELKKENRQIKCKHTIKQPEKSLKVNLLKTYKGRVPLSAPGAAGSAAP